MYLNTNIEDSVIEIDCSNDLFYKSWCLSIDNKKVDFLYENLKPYLKNWLTMLENAETRGGKSFYYLAHVLIQKGHDPCEKINLWLEQARFKSSPLEELELVLISALRAPRYLTSEMNGHRGVQIFDKYFTYYLINDILRATPEVDLSLIEYNFLTADECFADSDFALTLEFLDLSRWDQHIIMLVINDYSDSRISKLFHKQVRLIAKEKKELWQRLKKM